MEEKWMSINDYSRSFSISDMTVRRRIRTGKLQAVLRDGKYFIHVPDGHVAFSENDSAMSTMVASPVATAVKPRQQGASLAASTPNDFRHVPAHLAATIGSRDTVSVASAELLAFCESALRRFADFERRIVAENQSKLQLFQQDVNLKNIELKQLGQQVEDLQVLVNLMESRR